MVAIKWWKSRELIKWRILTFTLFKKTMDDESMKKENYITMVSEWVLNQTVRTVK